MKCKNRCIKRMLCTAFRIKRLGKPQKQNLLQENEAGLQRKCAQKSLDTGDYIMNLTFCNIKNDVSCT